MSLTPGWSRYCSAWAGRVLRRLRTVVAVVCSRLRTSASRVRRELLPAGLAAVVTLLLVGVPTSRSAAVQARVPVREIAALRSEASNTFVNPDGTFTTHVYPRPVNYQDDSGQWRKIDMSLVSSDKAGYATRSADAGYRADFKDILGDDLLRFDPGVGPAFTLSPLGASSAASAPRGTSELLYQGAWQDTDLRYSLLPQGVKESIVLGSAAAPSSFSFRLQSGADKRLTAVAQADGSVAFYVDGGGEPAFTLQAPIVQDSATTPGRFLPPADQQDAPAGSTPEKGGLPPKQIAPNVQRSAAAIGKATLGVQRQPDDSFRVTVTIDDKWLSNPARVFPVVVDPTITRQADIQDGYWNTASATSTPNMTDSELDVGYDGTGANDAAAVKFNLAVIPPGARVTSANVSVYGTRCIPTDTSQYASYGCPYWWLGTGYMTSTIDLYQITSAWNSTTQWQNLTTNATSLGEFGGQFYQSTGTHIPNWFSLAGTALAGKVQSIVNGTVANNGFLLKKIAGDATGLTFAGSRYADTSVAPRLDIEWSADGVQLSDPLHVHSNGADLWWQHYSGGLGPYATAVLNDTPTAYWRLDDPVGSPLGIADWSGNEANAGQSNVTLGQPGGTQDADQAASFNGSSSYTVASGTPLNNITDTFTIEAWVKRATTSTGLYTIFSRGESNGGGFRLQLTTANKIELGGGDCDGCGNGNYKQIALSTGTISDLNWHHVAATKSGATVHLYIDGTEGTQVLNSETLTNGWSRVDLGANVYADYANGGVPAHNSYWNGLIDEAAVYDHVLTGTQITAHVTAGHQSIAAFDRYEIHRSTTTGFTPSASTLIATIKDSAIQNYRDTTAKPGATFYYKVVTATNGGANSYISNETTATTPSAGNATVTIQPGLAGAIAKAASISSANTCANQGATQTIPVDSSDRGLLQFDLRQIPNGATVTAATLKLFTFSNPAASIEAHRVTSDWTEGTATSASCDGSGVTWTNRNQYVAWAAGGDFDSTTAGVVSDPGGNPHWDLITGTTGNPNGIKDLVQGWLNGSYANFGFLLKHTTEAGAPAIAYTSNDYATSLALHPQLTVTYTDNSAANGPSVGVNVQGATALAGTAPPVSGTVTVNAGASDDGRVTSVQLKLDGSNLGSALTTAPYSYSWNTTTASHGNHTLTAVASDDAGNQTTSAGLTVTVVNSAAPTVAAPTATSLSGGQFTVSTTASDDLAVSKVEFRIDGNRFATDSAAPYSVTLNTLTLPAYNGSHQLSAVAYDADSNTTTSTNTALTVANNASLSSNGAEITDAIRTANTQGDGRTAESSFGIWDAATNMIRNGGFQTNTTDWNTNGGATVSRDTTASKFGTAAMKMVMTTSASSGVFLIPGTRIAANPSTPYTFSFWAKGQVGGEQLNYGVEWRDSSQTFISNINSTVFVTTSWQRYTVSGTSAGATASLTPFIVNKNGSPGPAGTVWIDGAQVEQNSIATPYVETNGATASRSEAQPVLTNPPLNTTQGWLAIRLRMGSPSTALPHIVRAFQWGGTGTDNLEIYADSSEWSFEYITAGVSNRVDVPDTWAQDAARTVIIKWSSSQIAVSVNGGTFVTGSRTIADSQLTDNRLFIGNRDTLGRALDSDIFWFAAGSGTLSNTDAATINGYGNTDPTLAGLPAASNASLVWSADNLTTSTYVARANATISTASTIPAEMRYDPNAGSQDAAPITVALTNNSTSNWPTASIKLRYRWLNPDNSELSNSGDISIGADLGAGGNRNVSVTVQPPTLPAYLLRTRVTLRVDLYDSGCSCYFASQGNKPLEQTITVTRVQPDELGLESYQQYDTTSIGGGLTGSVNLFNGNQTVNWTPYSEPGIGISSVLSFTYNSLENGSVSPLGNNWSLALSGLTPFGLPLDIHPNAADSAAGRTAKWIGLTDADGTYQRFIGNTAGTYYTAPAGAHLYLKITTGDAQRYYGLIKPDRTAFYFDSSGYPTRVEDQDGNALVYTESTVAAGDDINGLTKQITAATDQGGRAFTFAYYTKTTTPVVALRGKLRSITDHIGRQLLFSYYDDANLLRITEKGSQNIDGSYLPDRSVVFTYTVPSGSGPAIPGTTSARLIPDPATAESTKLYSIIDFRGNETIWTYATSGASQWRVTTVNDRASEQTSYSYNTATLTTTVSRPLSRTGTYTFDTNGRATRLVDPLSETFNTVWTADNLPQTITNAATGKYIEFAYNANGQVTDKWDELRNHTTISYQNVAVDSNDVSGNWETGRTIAHFSRPTTIVQPVGNATPSNPTDYTTTFHYPSTSNDHVDTVTDALGNATTNTYNTNGTLASEALPNNNDGITRTIAYNTYDANGLVTKVTDPAGSISQTGYDAAGDRLWTQDPNHAAVTGDPTQYRTYTYYDGYGRVQRTSSPKSTTYQPGLLTWNDTAYDANDNATSRLNPRPGIGDSGIGSVTNTTFDAMDRPLVTTGPRGAADGGPVKTQTDFDAAGRPYQITTPNGVNDSGNIDLGMTKTVYDALDRPAQLIQYAVTGGNVDTSRTRTTSYCYDVAGDVRSTTAPKGAAAFTGCPSPTAQPYVYTAAPYTTEYVYDAAHRRTKTIDPSGTTVFQTTYNENSAATQTTDANNQSSQYSYDDRGAKIKEVEPYDSSSGRTLTSKWTYDALGELATFISPRAYDSAGGNPPFTNYVTTYHYDADARLSRTDLPTDATTAAAYTYTSYDPNGNTTLVSLPSTQNSVSNLSSTERTVDSFWDDGSIYMQTDPGAPTVHFAYTAEGWQSSRIPDLTTQPGTLDYSQAMYWDYYPDGLLKYVRDQGGERSSYTYDGNGNQLTARNADGVTQSSQTPVTITRTYDDLDQLQQLTAPKPGSSNNLVTTYVNDLHGLTTQADANIEQTTGGSQVNPGRTYITTYNSLDQAVTETDDHATPADTTDDEQTSYSYTPTGKLNSRVLSKANGIGGWTQEEKAASTYFDNGLDKTLTNYDGAGTTIEQHTLSYTTTGDVYVNGNKASDTFVIKNADGSTTCWTTACTATWSYDAQDRLVQENTGTGTTTSYTLDAQGNITSSVSGTTTITNTYNGQQLASTTINGATTRIVYDAGGNQACTVKSNWTGTTCPTAGNVNLLTRNLYDYENRLANYRAYDGAGNLTISSDYVNDPLDRVATQTTTSGGSTTTDQLAYVGDSGAVSSETLSTGETKTYGYDAFGNRQTITDQSGGTTTRLSYLHDPHSNISLLTDQSGAVKASYTYSAYGAATQKTSGISPSLNPYTYAGRRSDSASGTITFGTRRYNLNTSRWQQQDSFASSSSNFGLAASPASANRYLFTAANPANRIEFDGHYNDPGSDETCAAGSPGCLAGGAAPGPAPGPEPSPPPLTSPTSSDPGPDPGTEDPGLFDTGGGGGGNSTHPGGITLVAPRYISPESSICVPSFAPLYCIITNFEAGGSVTAPFIFSSINVEFDPNNGLTLSGLAGNHFGFSITDKSISRWNLIDHASNQAGYQGPYNRIGEGSIYEFSGTVEKSWDLPGGTLGLAAAITPDPGAPLSIPRLSVRSWRSINLGNGERATYWIQQNFRIVSGKDAKYYPAFAGGAALVLLSRVSVGFLIPPVWRPLPT